MKRLFIPIKDLEVFDEMHRKSDDGFTVDVEKDGQTTEQHREGIEFIKDVLRKGQKIRPILVRDNEDGTYTRLDGFKKTWAHFELGLPFIEAFVCSKEEYRQAAFIPYGKSEIRAWHGGLPKEDFTLFEGGERPDFDYDETIFLYKSPDPHGLKIEVSECIHVHWREYGRYRLSLGRRDFEELAEAISSIWEK